MAANRDVSGTFVEEIVRGRVVRIELEPFAYGRFGKMAQERRVRILEMVVDHRAFHVDMQAQNARLAECTEKLQKRWGFELRLGMGKAVTDELDLARKALASRKVAP